MFSERDVDGEESPHGAQQCPVADVDFFLDSWGSKRRTNYETDHDFLYKDPQTKSERRKMLLDRVRTSSRTSMSRILFLSSLSKRIVML